MNRADALRLLPGDHLTAGNHHFSAKCTWTGGGTVVRVTPRGGVWIDVDRWDGGGRRCVAYNHVIEWHRVTRRPGRAKPLHSVSETRRKLIELVTLAGPDAARDVLALVDLDHVRDILPQDCDAIYKAAEHELREIADLLA